MGLTLEQAQAKVGALYDRLQQRRPEVERQERYFRGDQPLRYATPEWRKLHQDRYRNFSDNWCGVVGRAPGERTELFGFRLSDEGEQLTAEEQQLWADWETNEGPAQSSQGFLMATVAKRSAAIVWGDDNDEPVLTWEHPAQVVVEYDPAVQRLRRSALKSWVEGDREFATLYTPDEIWKFQRAAVQAQVDQTGRTDSGLYVVGTMSTGLGAGWRPRQPEGDDVWPLDNPFGEVNVVEFRNRPMLGGEPLSDIAGTMAMQDAINMLWAYLFVAADYASMPARVVMGQEPPKIPILDANGQKIGEKPVDIEALTKGRMLWLTGQSTKVGQWDPAKLDVFTEVINVAVKHVASQTSTPIHYIVGDLGNVNGETLVATETPLAMKVRESHKFYQAPVRDVFRLMAKVRGEDGVAKACRTGIVQWRDPETRSNAQVSDAALKDKQVGWPFQAILERRYGLSQKQIERVMAQAQAELQDPVLAGVLRENLMAANAGMPGQGGVPGGQGGA